MQPLDSIAFLRTLSLAACAGACAVLLVPAGGASGLFAQAYEGRPCERGNPELRDLVRGETSDLFLMGGVTGDFADWSTSFLPAEGRPPERPEDYDAELYGDSDRHAWSCMYAASSAFDRNQDTAWSEGAEGAGLGEVLVVEVQDFAQPIQILPGFARSEQLFRWNNRPRRIRVYALEAGRTEAAQTGIVYGDLRVAARAEFELEDRRAWQEIQLPVDAHDDDSAAAHSRGLIAIEILSVYPGSRFQDTLISEVMNVPE